jgi:hypothetical protein
MNMYRVNLVKQDDEGTEYDLINLEITADQMIELLLHIQENEMGVGEPEVEEETEQTEEPTPAKKSKSTKKWPVKPCCGSKGQRHKKDCPEANNELPPAAVKREDGDALTAKIERDSAKKRLKSEEQDCVKMIEKGLSKEELYMMFPTVESLRINDLINAYGKSVAE